jgi:hypothetical protein
MGLSLPVLPFQTFINDYKRLKTDYSEIYDEIACGRGLGGPRKKWVPIDFLFPDLTRNSDTLPTFPKV